ncbi:MAG: hypothetical protein F6J96_34780 [Symploca sp. SIO1C2]|nr:hypothetical protein [Symploca sp. SIO1C2]
MAETLQDTAHDYKVTKDANDEDKSFLGGWTDRSIRLFQILSAKDWTEKGVPHINKFAKKLLKGKRINRAIEIINDEADRWATKIEGSRLTNLITRGSEQGTSVILPAD